MQTMRNIITTVLLTVFTGLHAQQPTLTELYQQIDEAIEQSPKFVADYEAQISRARTVYLQERNAERRMEQAKELYELYRAYNNDSAMAYIQQHIALADSLGHTEEADHGRALLAFQCSTVGLYTEALRILQPISSHRLSKEDKCDYYIACMHVYGELGYYTRISSMRDRFFQQSELYRDSIFQVADPNSEDYLLRKETQLYAAKQYEEALAVNSRRLKMAQPGTHEYAIVSYYRHLIYIAQGNTEQGKYWLAQSALCDIRNAVMDQASLISLAELINAEGNYEQSYRYIRFTWDCNSRFNTRMRSWQINPILTVIEKNYDNELKRKSRILKTTMTGISILALLLAAALFYSWRERKQLRRARAAQEESNRELKRLNSQLASQAETLSELNSQQAALNGQLAEANQVKEEYIGRFMSLCSQYVNKLDDYRKMVNRKMKNRDLDELFQITKSTELKEKELEELYENFDSVFLHLFPTFIDDFNALLLPELQIHPKEEHRLTTDIRIFALIRLGIEDSSKIAEFLHKSVNTIYNYRARIKNGAAGDREHFEQAVKTIGRYTV